MFYVPELARFLSKDMIRRPGKNPYTYALNNPPGLVDPDGAQELPAGFDNPNLKMRPPVDPKRAWESVTGGQQFQKPVTIAIFYNFSTLTLTPDMRNEVNRIFQECVRRGNQYSALEVTWTETALRINSMGRYPNAKIGRFETKDRTIVSTIVEDSLTYNALGAGSQATWGAAINPTRIAEDATEQKISLGEGAGLTIAHELALHVIIGKIGHYKDSGCVDAKRAEAKSVFSDEACRAFRRALGMSGY